MTFNKFVFLVAISISVILTGCATTQPNHYVRDTTNFGSSGHNVIVYKSYDQLLAETKIMRHKRRNNIRGHVTFSFGTRFSFKNYRGGPRTYFRSRHRMNRFRHSPRRRH